MSRRRFEVSASGFDPVLQGLGADPSGSSIRTGLRVPPLSTISASPDGTGPTGANRYLFQLATYRVSPGKCTWVVGVKQGIRIGLNSSGAGMTTYPATIAQVDPYWSFVDGNVSWHLRYVASPPVLNNLTTTLNTVSFQRRWVDDSALIYETASFNAANLDGNGKPDDYVSGLTKYTAPYNGLPLGTALGGLGTWTDLRFKYDDPSKQSLDPIVVPGGGAVVLYASVYQPNAAHTQTLTIPAGYPLNVTGFTEEAFLAAYPKAQYWSVMGALVIETEG